MEEELKLFTYTNWKLQGTHTVCTPGEAHSRKGGMDSNAQCSGKTVSDQYKPVAQVSRDSSLASVSGSVQPTAMYTQTI